MKKLLVLLILLGLLPVLPARCEPARADYADQGGVHVFVENEKAGLADADGNALLPAEYDSIEPFAGADFTVVHRGDLAGVVRRDGTLAVPCEWEVVELSAALRVAVCWNDVEAQVAVDLDAGGTLLSGGVRTVLSADDRFLYRFQYGAEGFGYDPPYHTDVYGRDGALRFGVDAWLIRGFAQELAVAQFDDFDYGMIDDGGNVIVRGLCESPWTDGQDYAYDDAPCTGAIHTVREVKNPLNDWLRPVKLDRRHVLYYLDLLGVRKEGRFAEALLSFYKNGCACGIVEPDGKVRFEMTGAAIYGPDAAGLYRVQTSGYDGIDRPQDLWVYVDRNGNPAFDGQYREAYPFVDGAAVVNERGKWHLIDTAGNRVGGLEWSWNPDMWSTDALALPVIPIENPDGGGYRLIDRRGEYATDEVFLEAFEVFSGRLMPVDLNDNLCVLDADGRVALRLPGRDCILYALDDEAVHVYRNGRRGVMAIAGARAGQWIVEPVYAEVELLENGSGYRLRLGDDDDGAAVYADRDGRVLGPAPAFYAYDEWDDF